MKLTKRLLALLLVLVMMLAVTACGDEDDSSSKKGSSRKKDNTEQTVTPTDEPEPTNEPTDGPEPSVAVVTETPTPTPTEKPADPTPTPVVSGGDLSYAMLKGEWTGSRTLDTKTFMTAYMGISGDDENAQIMNALFDAMKKKGFDSKIYVDLSLDFTSDEDCTFKFSMDATEFGTDFKKYFSDVDNVLEFVGQMYGMDAATLKATLQASGMSTDQLMAQIADEMEDAFDMDELNQNQEQESTYEIRDDRIYLDNDEAAYFLYDEAKKALVIVTNDTSDQNMAFAFSFLDGFELTK